MRTPPRVALAVAAAFTAALAAVGVTTDPAPATAAATATMCPVSSCTGSQLITDTSPGMSASWYVEDNEGHPPGHNAPQGWIDGFQFGSVNPMCADTIKTATTPFLGHAACVGLNPDGRLDAAGGYPTVSLCAVMGRTDCARWAVLDARGVELVDAEVRAGLTPANVTSLMRLLAIARARGWRV